MDETGFDEWPDTVPWWVDAAAAGDVDLASCALADLSELADPELPAVDDGAGPLPLSAQETLLAAGLAGPGPDGQRLLTSLVGRDLSQDEWLTAVQLWETQDAWLTGQKSLAVAGFAGPEPVSVDGFGDDEALMTELALATGCAEGFAYTQILTARLLTSTLVRTGDLLRAGRLSPYRARLIVDELARLHPDVARRVEDRVLGTAAQVPTGRLRADLTKHTRRVDRQAGNDRKVDQLVKAAKGRRVVFDPHGEDGTGLMGLYAYLPPVEALAVQSMLRQVAGPHRRADGRSQDERIADALTGMVIGFDPNHPGQPITPKKLVQVLIDLPTLLRLRDHDGELLGYGHLPAEVIRELTDNAAWQRLVYDPADGHLLDAGTTIHDFPQLSTYLHLRDRYDRFPGGTRHHGNDLDHTHAFKPKNKTKTGDGKDGESRVGDPATGTTAEATAGEGDGKAETDAGATKRRSRRGKQPDSTTPTTTAAEPAAARRQAARPQADPTPVDTDSTPTRADAPSAGPGSTSTTPTDPTPAEVDATAAAEPEASTGTTDEAAAAVEPDAATEASATAKPGAVVEPDAATKPEVTVGAGNGPDAAAEPGTAVAAVDPAAAHGAAMDNDAVTGHTAPPTHPAAAGRPDASDGPSGTRACVGTDTSQHAAHRDDPAATPRTPESSASPPADQEEGGRTAANNMAALSRRHHRAKTFLGFHYRHLDNAVLEWTTPLGRIYYTYPHDYRPDSDTTGDTSGDSDPPPPAGTG
ncbi:hypothetical protein acdb102_28410 [Acidothermaceae bacterium B102]|nr:hypothetical protein acdb102_28410 [Acidothermaceae bacterium B102]